MHVLGDQASNGSLHRNVFKKVSYILKWLNGTDTSVLVKAFRDPPSCLLHQESTTLHRVRSTTGHREVGLAAQHFGIRSVRIRRAQLVSSCLMEPDSDAAATQLTLSAAF